jgi:hypothetical protein
MPTRQDEAKGRRELDTAKKKKKKEGLRFDGLLEVHLYRASTVLKGRAWIVDHACRETSCQCGCGIF